MATTRILLAFRNNTSNQPNNSIPGQWNSFFDEATTGELSSNLLDTTNTGTGFSLVNVGGWTTSSGTSWTSEDELGYATTAWIQWWTLAVSNGPATMIIGDLPAGSTYSMKFAGQNANSARDLQCSVNGGSAVTYNANGNISPPNPLAEATGTVPLGGELTLVFNAVSVNAILQFIDLTIITADAAEISTITGDGLYTVRAGESFTVAGSGFEAAQGDGVVDIDGVECDIVSWADDEIEAIAPLEGIMFGGGKVLEVAPDANDPDSVSNITYLPPTGMEYVTYDGSTPTRNTIWWNATTNAPVAGLVSGCQAYYVPIATLIGDTETCTFEVEDGTGVITLLNVVEPGDYENDSIILRDEADGTDSSPYTIIVYLERELSFSLNDPVEEFSGTLTSVLEQELSFDLNDPVEIFSGTLTLDDSTEIILSFTISDPVETFEGSIETIPAEVIEVSFTLNDPVETFSGTMKILVDKDFTFIGNDPIESLYIRIDNPPKITPLPFSTPHLVRSSNPGLPGGSPI